MRNLKDDSDKIEPAQYVVIKWIDSPHYMR